MIMKYYKQILFKPFIMKKHQLKHYLQKKFYNSKLEDYNKQHFFNSNLKKRNYHILQFYVNNKTYNYVHIYNCLSEEEEKKIQHNITYIM